MTRAAKAEQVIANVEQARQALVKAQVELHIVRSQRKILCSCGKRHSIAKLEVLVTHWYHEPHGCTGGDYWSEGEWQFVCPVDGTRNRLMFDDYRVEYEKRDSIGIAAEPTFKSIYRGLFAKSRDVYKDDDRSVAHYNNYYVDRHREQFELPRSP